MSTKQSTREESLSEHIARDIREGRFPQQSDRQAVSNSEWGPVPDAGTEADNLTPVAFVEGDGAVRMLRWQPNVSAFDYPVGTLLYAGAPLALLDALERKDAEIARLRAELQDIADYPEPDSVEMRRMARYALSTHTEQREA